MADATQSLFDTLAGSFGHGIDRPGLNAFVANSQATNGLRSAQTEEALNRAQQEQEEMKAHADLESSLASVVDDNGKPLLQPSAAHLVANELKGHFGNAQNVMQALNEAQKVHNTSVLSNPNNLNTPDATAAAAGIQGKLPEPVAAPNNMIVPAGVTPNIQQTPQGAAQTAQTKALTGLDVARAEEEYARAKHQNSAGLGSLDPQTLDDAASVVMADPTKMSQYSGFGQSGQTNKDGINNAISRKLNAAGMTVNDMIRQRALAHASIGAAGAAAKQAEALDAYTPLVKGNGDRILQILDQVGADGGDMPLLAGLQRAAGRNLGDDDLAELHSVFGTYQNEVARMIASSPTMAGVLSDKARGDVQAMAPENMTASQARRVINRINVEIDLRRHGVQNALDNSTGAQLPVTAQPGAGGAVAAPASGGDSAVNLDDYLTRMGFPAKK